MSLNPTATPTQIAELLYDLFAVGAVIPDGLRLVAQERRVPLDEVVAIQEAAFAMALAPEPDEAEDTSDPDSTAPNPGRWVCWDASGVRVSYDFNAAEEAAYEYVFRGDYAMPGIGEWTSFVEVQVTATEEWTEDASGETVHVPLYPGSPDCNGMAGDGEGDDDGHLWRRVSSHGDGAGTFITEKCVWCGLLKDTRTRPQCPDCGVTLTIEAIRYRREESA